jgi:hypothetical protein
VARGAAGLGLLVELRRSDARVQYLVEGRSAWVQLHDLGPPPQAVQPGSLEALVSALLKLLDAKEMELSRLEGSRWRLLASHGAIATRTIDEVRGMLGERLRAWVLRPSGMHRIQSAFEIEALTHPSGGAAPGG